jgi:hypothetical protein
MKGKYQIGRRVVLGTTAVLMALLAAQRAGAVPIFGHAAAMWLKIAALAMFVITIWLLFGNAAVWRKRDAIQIKSEGVSSRKLNVPMLVSGIASMICALFIVFVGNNFLIHQWSVDPEVVSYLIAFLFSGGAAVAGLAMIRPGIMTFRSRNR